MNALARYLPIAIEATTPSVDLADPTAVHARQAARAMAHAAGLGDEAREGLATAVSEVVTNADLHGSPPIRMQGWADPGEVIIAVSDCGSGPAHHDVGQRPLAREVGEGGLGLWLAAQLVADLTMGRHGDGFTVRMHARG